MKLFRYKYVFFLVIALICFLIAYSNPEKRTLNIVLGSINAFVAVWSFRENGKK